MNKYKQPNATLRHMAFAVCGVLAATSFTHAGLDGPITVDWEFRPNNGNENPPQWRLLEQDLVGYSLSEEPDPRFEGVAALFAEDGVDVRLANSSSWTLPQLRDPIGISLGEGAEMLLRGNFTAITDFDAESSDVAAGIAFREFLFETDEIIESEQPIIGVSKLAGAGDLTVISGASGDPAPVLAGVVTPVDLRIEGYSGEIEVLNDNSAASDPDEEPFNGSLALGIFAGSPDSLDGLDPEDFLGFLLGGLPSDGPELIGKLDQTITATALSRDEFSDDIPFAFSWAQAVGVTGNTVDGIADGADISASATSGESRIVEEDSEGGFDEFAASVNLGAGIGYLGETSSISGDVSISGEAMSDASDVLLEDGFALGINAAIGAGMIGDVDGSISGDAETETRVSITGTATSGEADVDATEDGLVAGASLAVGIGYGGFVSGDIAETDLSAAATSVEADAFAQEGVSIAGSVGLGAGYIGFTGGSLQDSTITSTVETGIANTGGNLLLPDTIPVSQEAGLSLSIGLGAGYIGELGGVSETEEGSGTEVTTTVSTNLTKAKGEFAALADSSSIGFGLAGFEETFGLVLESLSPLSLIAIDLLQNEEVSLDPTELLGEFVESDSEIPESALDGFAGTVNVTVRADGEDDGADAIAIIYGPQEEEQTPGDLIEGEGGFGFEEFDGAIALADADAIGVAYDIVGSVDTTIEVEAISGTAVADASGFSESGALADTDSDAYGLIGEIYADLEAETNTVSGTITATATAGTSTATAFDDEEFDGGSAQATAQADAYAMLGGFVGARPEEPEGPLELDESEEGPEPVLAQVDADFIATANGGTSTATAYGEALTDAAAQAYGIYGDYEESDVGVEFTDFAVEADFTEDSSFESTAIAGTATAYSYDDDAAADAGARAAAMRDIEDFRGDFSATVTMTATAGTAIATAYEDAAAQADAQAFSIELTDDDKDFIGNYLGDSTIIARAGIAEAIVTEEEDDEEPIPFDEPIVEAFGLEFPDTDEDAEADATASAYVLKDLTLLEGDFGGTHDVQAYAGEATASTIFDGESAYAVAEAKGYGIEMDSGEQLIDGDYTANTTLTVVGGVATATSLDDSEATTDVLAYLFDFSESGDSEFKGNFTEDSVVALDVTAGTSTATVSLDEDPDSEFFGANADADSLIENASVIDDVEKFTGDFAGTVNLVVRDGEAEVDSFASVDIELDSDVIDLQDLVESDGPIDFISVDSNADTEVAVSVIDFAGDTKDFEGDFTATIGSEEEGGLALVKSGAALSEVEVTISNNSSVNLDLDSSANSEIDDFAIMEDIDRFTGDIDATIGASLATGSSIATNYVELNDVRLEVDGSREMYFSSDADSRTEADIYDFSDGIMQGNVGGSADIDVTNGEAESTTVVSFNETDGRPAKVFLESDADASAKFFVLDDLETFEAEPEEEPQELLALEADSEEAPLSGIFDATVDATINAGTATSASVIDSLDIQTNRTITIDSTANASTEGWMIEFERVSGDDENFEGFNGTYAGDVTIVANSGDSRSYVGIGSEDLLQEVDIIEGDFDPVTLKINRTEEDEQDDYGDQARSVVVGFEAISNFLGDFTGDLSLTAKAGTSIAEVDIISDENVGVVRSTADSVARARAQGFRFVRDARFEGNFSGNMDILADASESTSYASNPTGRAQSNARTVAIAFDGVESYVGDLGGSLDVDALSGNSYSLGSQGNVRARAFADAAGLGVAFEDLFTSVLNGDILGTIEVLADAGTAQAVVPEGELGLDDLAEGAQYNAEAWASAVGLHADIDGNVTEAASFVIEANGGQAYANGGTLLEGNIQNVEIQLIGQREVNAEADAYAAAIYGELSGNFDGSIEVDATGGTAFAFQDNSSLQGHGGGILINSEQIEGDNVQDSVLFVGSTADASAIATGIGNRVDAISPAEGDEEIIPVSVAGTIDVTATGGDAVFSMNDTFTGVGDEVVESDFLISETYTFGTENRPNNASALAVGIDGNVYAESITANITATATGGTVVYERIGSLQVLVDEVVLSTENVESYEEQFERGPGDASAFAAGIAGNTVVVGELGPEGSITATVTAGLTGTTFTEGTLPLLDESIEQAEGEAGEGAFVLPDAPVAADFPESLPEFDEESFGADYAFAAGIMTYDAGLLPADDVEGVPAEVETSLLEILISTSVEAFVNVPEDGELNEQSSYAAAIYSGQGDDDITLAEGAILVGDINTGGGLNTLKVTGNTILEGDILSSSLGWIDEWLSIDNGQGTVDFDIESGLFTAIRTVNVSDLSGDIEISSDGGLAPILSTNEGETSLISVSGETAGVNIAEGATILPAFSADSELDGLVGGAWTIIDSTGTIADGGAVIDDSLTPYNLSTNLINAETDEYQIVIDSIRILDEEETPGTVQTSDAIVTAGQAVMVDMSDHASLMRGLLRRNLASSNAMPLGAAGPDAAELEHGRRMENGEWLGYVSAFGNIGKQDSEGGFAGFDYDTYGVTIGFEKLFGEQLILGIAGTYADTTIDGLNSSGGGDSDLYGGAVYFNWFSEAWYTEGGFTYGSADNEFRRVGAINPMDDLGVFTGENDSTMLGGWFEIGRTHRTDSGITVEPFARVTYINGDHDGYQETGPTGVDPLFEQLVSDDKTDNLKSEIGVRVGHEWLYEGGESFLIEFKAAWEHEYADNNVEVDTIYLGDPFVLRSVESDENAFVGGIRTEWRNGKGFAFSLDYEPTFAGNWYNHAFGGSLQFNW